MHSYIVYQTVNILFSAVGLFWVGWDIHNDLDLTQAGLEWTFLSMNPLLVGYGIRYMVDIPSHGHSHLPNSGAGFMW
jgi:hypothetical protein